MLGLEIGRNGQEQFSEDGRRQQGEGREAPPSSFLVFFRSQQSLCSNGRDQGRNGNFHREWSTLKELVDPKIPKMPKKGSKKAVAEAAPAADATMVEAAPAEVVPEAKEAAAAAPAAETKVTSPAKKLTAAQEKKAAAAAAAAPEAAPAGDAAMAETTPAEVAPAAKADAAEAPAAEMSTEQAEAEASVEAEEKVEGEAAAKEGAVAKVGEKKKKEQKKKETPERQPGSVRLFAGQCGRFPPTRWDPDFPSAPFKHILGIRAVHIRACPPLVCLELLPVTVLLNLASLSLGTAEPSRFFSTQGCHGGGSHRGLQQGILALLRSILDHQVNETGLIPAAKLADLYRQDRMSA